MTNERKKEIENLTVDLLKEYDLFRVNGAAPIFVKDELQKRFGYGYRFYETPMESNLQGAIFQGKNQIVRIVVNSTIDNVGRKNFTYAHEMGHYFLMHNLSTLACTQANVEGGFSVKDPQEVEANYFASYFLMPKDYVYWNFYNAMKTFLLMPNPYQPLYVDNKNYHRVWKLMCSYFESRCGVSGSALKYRLEELGLLRWNFHPKPQTKKSIWDSFI